MARGPQPTTKPVPHKHTCGIHIPHLVPQLDVEAEVDVEVLVVVIVEDAVRLPGLPPEALEVDPGVVNDAVVVGVHQDRAVGH